MTSTQTQHVTILVQPLVKYYKSITYHLILY